MTELRLTPGHHLYRTADGSWNAMAPGDRFLRLQVDAPEFEHFVAAIHGEAPVDDSQGELYEHFAAALATHGLLSPPAPRQARPRPATVLVQGVDTPLGRQVLALLDSEVQVSTGPVTPESVRHSSLLITCAGWLPDTAWQQLGRWCADGGTAWHMAYVEGIRLFIGPLAIPGSSAGYRDTRGRRLAAATAPDALLGHWAYLDSATHKPPVPWPGPGALAVAAGHMVTDVLAYLDGRDAPGALDQVELDPVDLLVHRHPVLPLPTFAD